MARLQSRAQRWMVQTYEAVQLAQREFSHKRAHTNENSTQIHLSLLKVQLRLFQKILVRRVTR